MKKKIYRIVSELLAVAFLLALVSCSGSEAPQATSEAKPEDKSAVAQTQPAEPQQEQAAKEMSNSEQTQSSETAAQSTETNQPAVSETVSITGTVILSDAGVLIQTDQGEYGVTGQDLTDMAGKTVNIIGTLQESGGRQMIQVISVVEAQ